MILILIYDQLWVMFSNESCEHTLFCACLLKRKGVDSLMHFILLVTLILRFFSFDLSS